LWRFATLARSAAQQQQQALQQRVPQRLHLSVVRAAAAPGHAVAASRIVRNRAGVVARSLAVGAVRAAAVRGVGVRVVGEMVAGATAGRARVDAVVTVHLAGLAVAGKTW
jgi:hypothetical protein